MKHFKLWGTIALALTLLAGSGCSLMQSQPDQGDAAEGKGGAVGRYYDFDDIQVPTALKLDKDRSILFRVGAFKAGVLVLKDNLQVESLINYFTDTMAKDNWVLKGSFKYPLVGMFFAKQGKTCVIRIKEHTFSTEVEIWVAPTN